MNIPICLIGSLIEAKIWIENNYDIDVYDSLILQNDILVEDIKKFCNFLNEVSINKKIAIIYGFNKLNYSKQSILLKSFESLGDNVVVIIHSFICVPFVINTRCDIEFLKISSEIQENVNYIFDYFFKNLVDKSLTKEKMNGIKIYLEVLNLHKLNLLSNDYMDCILNDLKG